MPEWLVERGIGETRAALIEDGEIVEAQIELDGAVAAGSVIQARLASIGNNGRNAIALGEGSIEYLLPRGAVGVTQGATVTIEVTREKIPGTEPWKRPLARLTDLPVEELPPPVERLGGHALPFPARTDALGDAGWNDLIDEARTGLVTFAGGQLRISPTPAMTLIDVDGYLAPDELAVLGAGEAARAIGRLDIGGSIGIDLPTIAGKTARQASAAAIDDRLSPPFERTAVNGFGFVQIVRPRARPSLLETWGDRASAEARTLLRLAAFEEPGAKRLVSHPAVSAILEANPEWLDTLARQVGGAISLRSDASLAMSGGHAEPA